MQKADDNFKLIKIPQIIDDCYLFFAQNKDHIPFLIKRVYIISKADINKPRGFHAHKKTRQVLFCIQGSIKLVLDDGENKRRTILNKPEIGVFIDKMVWHEMHDFKKNTILLVLASLKFNPKDYIRDYKQFKKIAQKYNEKGPKKN